MRRTMLLCPFWLFLIGSVGCQRGQSTLNIEPYKSFGEAIRRYPVDAKGYSRAFSARFQRIAGLWPESKGAVREMLFSRDMRLQVAGLTLYRYEPDNDDDGSPSRAIKSRIRQLYENGDCATVRAAALSRLVIYDKQFAVSEARRILQEGSVFDRQLWDEAADVLKWWLPKRELQGLFSKLLLERKYVAEEILRREEGLPTESKLVNALEESNVGLLTPYYVSRLEGETLQARLDAQRSSAAKRLDRILGCNLASYPIRREELTRSAAVYDIRDWYEKHKELIEKGEPVPAFRLRELPRPKAHGLPD